ncbi:pentapeptide repeat-containing protein [Desulfocapsa sp. AH-315-G09]|nr:pentapeptide repeat-containing protein [Desulfocapsa sp.]MBN4065121.1 pentapeptide repeat-containing protein [Desulfocapsa sp. AH-315-G09]
MFCLQRFVCFVPYSLISILKKKKTESAFNRKRLKIIPRHFHLLRGRCKKSGFAWLTLLSLSLLANHVNAGNLSTSTEVQNNINILIETRSCPQCDLSGANLSRLDLSGTNLDGANLSRSKLALANLSEANLQNADLREANFSGADLANTDMRGADLTGTIFVGAYMVGTMLDGKMITTTPYASDKISDVEESVYVEDIVKSKTPQDPKALNIGMRKDFEETPPVIPAKTIEEKITQETETVDPVESVTFAYAETSEEMLPSQSAGAPAAKVAPAIDEVRIQEGTMVTEDLPEFAETKKEPYQSQLNDNTIEESKETEGVLLNEAFADESKVEGLVNNDKRSVAEDSPQSIDVPEESEGIVQSVLNMFSSVEPSTEVLRNAAVLLDSNHCYGCDLQGVNLSGENLDGADLEGANLSKAILKNVDLEGANLKGANLSGADLSGADLSEADLYKADLSGANLSDANLENALLDDANFTGVIGYDSPGILLLDVQ